MTSYSMCSGAGTTDMDVSDDVRHGCRSAATHPSVERIWVYARHGARWCNMKVCIILV